MRYRQRVEKMRDCPPRQPDGELYDVDGTVADPKHCGFDLLAVKEGQRSSTRLKRQLEAVLEFQQAACGVEIHLSIAGRTESRLCVKNVAKLNLEFYHDNHFLHLFSQAHGFSCRAADAFAYADHGVGGVCQTTLSSKADAFATIIREDRENRSGKN